MIKILCLILFVGIAEASIGNIASNLDDTASIVAKLLWAACILVGIALIITSLTQYQVHRSNPKLVPLTTPVVYFLLGICAFAIPFADIVFGFTDGFKGSSVTKDYSISNID